MKTLKVNFTMPQDIADALKRRVGKRKCSAFVSAAVLERLNKLEQEQLRQALIEGYQARREEDAQINEEWEIPTAETWK